MAVYIAPAERCVYDSYITNVSPAAMALSWQALDAISQTLESESPKSILEYGSGISTFLLAQYAEQRGLRVRSFDSDRDWAAKTATFIVEHGLDK